MSPMVAIGCRGRVVDPFVTSPRGGQWYRRCVRAAAATVRHVCTGPPPQRTWPQGLTVLGIETSCDDSCAAVVRSDHSILSNVVVSQWQSIHAKEGGIHPLLAARAHADNVDAVIDEALKRAKITMDDVDVVAVTQGPGLALSLQEGLRAAKTLVEEHNKPLMAVHHMAAHALTGRLGNPELQYPFLTALMSGGHALLVRCDGATDFTILGKGMDDAPGEVFDKVARYLGCDLGASTSGGAMIEALAAQGNKHAHAFVVPLRNHRNCNFSFSGLKSAVAKHISITKEINGNGQLTLEQQRNIAASFQHTLVRHICTRVARLLTFCKQSCGPEPTHLVASGGVLRNSAVRSGLQGVCDTLGCKTVYPPPDLCTDNAVMIAWAAIEAMADGQPFVDNPRQLVFKSRWPVGPDHSDRIAQKGVKVCSKMMARVGLGEQDEAGPVYRSPRDLRSLS